MNRILRFALLCVWIPVGYADQGSFTNSGGSGSAGSGVYVTSNVAAPAGTVTLNCPAISTGACGGGSFAYSSTDGTRAISASFTTGTFVESCAGGGKGGHVTCAYSFTGYFSGTLTVNGRAQAITGVTSQGFGTGGAAASGISAYNSAYAPFYYSDSEQIHRADDLQGSNQISFGSQGGDVGQFYGAYGIALDSANRIYVADTYNCRIVRIDDMNGSNWTTYGACGSGQGQFYDPSGIAVDSAGKIYVMDTGNTRVVRMDDMTGANWAAYGSVGSGVGQFSQWLQSVAVDGSGRIYIPDTGNKRLVRFDDMVGTNWTVLTQSPVVNGASYSLQSPAAVALDSAGKVYIADNEYYQPAVVRVDDMTGANWTSIYTGANSGLNSISVDSGGTVFAGGGGARFVVNMSAVLTSSGAIGPIGSYYVFGVTPVPLPNPHPSAISLSPPTVDFSQNVGTSGSLPIVVSNFGGSPLNVGTISVNGGFTESNNCPGILTAGSNCTVSISFAPSMTGPASGLLTITDNSGNLGTAQTVILTGTGTAPAASVTPASLNFPSQVVNTTSNPRTVTLQNTGSGPLQVTGVSTAAPFSQTNTCIGAVASGTSCTITVSFTPTALGSASGSLTIADNAGTQTVNLTGAGSGPVSFSPTTLAFSTVVVGATSTPRSVTVTNRINAPLSFTSIVASAGYAIASNTCGTGIAGGASCSIDVTFSPTTTGTINGAVTFTDSAFTSPQTLSLTGTGSAPVTLSAASLSFSTVVVGNTSSARTVTLTNHQSAALHFSGIATSVGFAIASNTCGTSVSAGANCTVGVTFSPTATGAATGTLTFTDDAPNSPQVVSLTGAGSASVTLSATTLNFNSVTVGSTSSARTVTLTNHQSASLSFSGITTTTGFAVASNTCGASIAGGASCTIGVTFSPTATGAATGTLTFSDNAAASPQTITLTGTGR